MKVLFITEKYVTKPEYGLTNQEVNLIGSYKDAFGNDPNFTYEHVTISKEPGSIFTAAEMSHELLTREYDIAVVSQIGECTVSLDTAKKVGKKLFIAIWDAPALVTSDLYTNFRLFIKAKPDIGYVKYPCSILDYSEYCNMLAFDFGYGEIFPNIYGVSVPQDSRYYFPATEEEKIYDVVFCGGIATSERFVITSELKKRGVNIELFGGRGPSGQNLSFDEYASKHRLAKISLNFGHSGAHRHRKGRIFEIAASNAFMVTTYPETIRFKSNAWFVENKHYASMNESNYYDVVTYYLNNPDLRIQMSNDMHKHYMENYTSKHWWNKIFNMVGDKY